MDGPLALAESALAEAADLRRLAGQVHELMAQVTAELERAVYECDAAGRDRERLSLVAGRVRRQGSLLEDAASSILRWASST